MTRRGGRERYRPRDLQRGLVRDAGDWPIRVDPLCPPRPLATPIACAHGIPWTTCTACSKPRAR